VAAGLVLALREHGFMTPLVTFEKSATSGLAPGQATGTLLGWTTCRSEPSSASPPSTGASSRLSASSSLSRNGMGTLWENDNAEASLPLQFSQYCDFSERPTP
jgi:hypothetical protein